ncbi:LIPS lipase, partial [Onychorhynchus coronatus]|nr:LIPS lipase [Onychorhynchus coronatus]
FAAALGQLRAVLCLAGRMLQVARPGSLFPDGDEAEGEREAGGKEEEEEEEKEGMSELVLREYSTMHNGCFYGRCLGFQVRFGGRFGVFGVLGMWEWDGGTRRKRD